MGRAVLAVVFALALTALAFAALAFATLGAACFRVAGALPAELFAVADFRDLARAGVLTSVLDDFLRVFLDIRLPFVAFHGPSWRVAARHMARKIRPFAAGQIGYPRAMVTGDST
ncbi:MAG: hypothetical protein BGP05_20075 [Rhizobiales bacterium 62-47]|nr:MAG: hypothetical protein BGP05_20075 [Rhizobiales bacterium 62-47]